MNILYVTSEAVPFLSLIHILWFVLLSAMSGIVLKNLEGRAAK